MPRARELTVRVPPQRSEFFFFIVKLTSASSCDVTSSRSVKRRLGGKMVDNHKMLQSH